MKWWYFFIFLLLSLALQGMNVSVNTYVFYAKDNPFLDINLRILTSKLSFIQEEGLYKASADITILIKKQEDMSIAGWEKYKLNSIPQLEKKDFFDQKRFFLNPGNYLVSIFIADGQDSTNSFGMDKWINIEKKNNFSFSDIVLANYIENRPDGPMVRNGVYMEPFTYDLVNESQQVLNFYTELYTLKNSENYLLSFSIHEGLVVNDTSKAIYTKYKKMNSAEVIPILNSIYLNELPSGEYYLKIAVIDKSRNIIIEKNAFFINKNFAADIAAKRDYNKNYKNSFAENLDSATCHYSLLALAPLLPTQHGKIMNDIMRKGSLETKRYFIYQYWKEEYPKAPEIAYNAYMKVAKAVDEKFYNSVGKGIQTDRGYIYLKYGKPNKVITIDDEANTPPYEIWYYDFIDRTTQSNVRFIFYSPLLSNEYDLLHSTCYGEKSNQQWEVILYKNSPNERKNSSSSFDATTMQANFNRKARRLFEDM
ncbi:MAG: hypothetical protein RLZZ546_2018 [Bacteroidota bacterium]|jgi:GWxTD domain-containing protein